MIGTNSRMEGVQKPSKSYEKVKIYDQRSRIKSEDRRIAINNIEPDKAYKKWATGMKDEEYPTKHWLSKQKKRIREVSTKDDTDEEKVKVETSSQRQ